MSFDRLPYYISGLVLVGDAGGMAPPFNDEEIVPALKAGHFVVHCAAQALSHRSRMDSDRAVSEYPELLREGYGGYYQLGRALAALIEKPQIMQLYTNRGLPIPRLMAFANRLLSDGYERKGGDLDDRLVTVPTRLVPSL